MTMHRALRTSQLSAALRRSWTSATSVALAVLFGACSSGDVDPAPSFSGGQTSPGSGGSGSVNAPSVSPGSTSNNSPSTNTPSTTNSNQQTASSTNNSESLPTNLPQTNGTAGSGSNSNNNNTNSGTQGSGGAGGAGTNTASGGSAGSANTMGVAGSSAMPPPAGAAGTSGNGSAGASGTTQPAADTTPDIPCPDGATFCSGFEGTTLPAGAAFEPSDLMPGFGTQMLLDTSQAHSGKQSLFMPSGFNFYRMLDVAVPGNNFWVRVYMRSDVGLGAPGSTHASVYMASVLPPGTYNGDQAVELSEQFGQVQLNANDDRYGSSGPNPNGSTPGTTLPSNAWVCLETQYDGDSGNVLVFADGQQLINAQGWKKRSYKTFRFGYLRYDSPVRNVWLDDVVVSSNRVGCQ